MKKIATSATWVEQEMVVSSVLDCVHHHEPDFSAQFSFAKAIFHKFRCFTISQERCLIKAGICSITKIQGLPQQNGDPLRFINKLQKKKQSFMFYQLPDATWRLLCFAGSGVGFFPIVPVPLGCSFHCPSKKAPPVSYCHCPEEFVFCNNPASFPQIKTLTFKQQLKGGWEQLKSASEGKSAKGIRGRWLRVRTRPSQHSYLLYYEDDKHFSMHVMRT